MTITYSYETAESGFVNQWSGIFYDYDAGFNDAASASSSGTNANRACWWFNALSDLVAAGFIVGTSIIDSITFGCYVDYWSYNPAATSGWVLYGLSNGELGTTLDNSDFSPSLPGASLITGAITSWTTSAYNEFGYSYPTQTINLNAGVVGGASNVFLLAYTQSGGYGMMVYDAEVKTNPSNGAHPAYLKIDWHTPSTSKPTTLMTMGVA